MAGDTQRRGRGRAVIAVSVLLFLPTTGLAGTTALYSLGYGTTSSSMAGATLASGSDALNQFGNPATCGWTWQITERWDVSAMFGRSFNQSVATTVSKVDAFHSHAKENHDQYSAQLQFGWRF